MISSAPRCRFVRLLPPRLRRRCDFSNVGLVGADEYLQPIVEEHKQKLIQLLILLILLEISA